MVADYYETFSSSWYFGDLSRKETESNLMKSHNGVGVFAIRNSERDPGNYTLSVKDRTKDNKRIYTVKHYRIRSMDNGMGFYVTIASKFATLKEFVQYYSGNVFFLQSNC